MSASAWADAVAACVVGADRAGQPPPLPPELAGATPEAGPGALLAAAAALGPWGMAGRVPSGAAVPLGPVDDARPECGDAAAARLELILSDAAMGRFRAEWCGLARAAGVQPPPGLALALFRATRKGEERADADAVLGPRRAWLAALDGAAPDVTGVSDGDAVPDADSDELPGLHDWTSPDLPRRAAGLRAMRAADPAAAREALLAAWKGEPADARAALLAALEAGLGMEDEPVLDGCLDDRSVQVRAEAARLLGLLPGSRRAARMAARAGAAVRFVPAGLLARVMKARGKLDVTLPDPDADPAVFRDGLGPKAQLAGGDGAGAKAALLRQIIGAAPLTAWGGHPPVDWIAAALAGDWQTALMLGWTEAAARERSAPWLSALLGALVPNLPAERGHWKYMAMTSLAATVSPADLEAAIAPALADSSSWVERLVDLCGHAWSAAFSQAVVRWAVQACERSMSPGAQVPGYFPAAYRIITHAAPDATLGLIAAMQVRWPVDAPDHTRRTLDNIVATLRFRADMHQEFAP